MIKEVCVSKIHCVCTVHLVLIVTVNGYNLTSCNSVNPNILCIITLWLHILVWAQLLTSWPGSLCHSLVIVLVEVYYIMHQCLGYKDMILDEGGCHDIFYCSLPKQGISLPTPFADRDSCHKQFISTVCCLLNYLQQGC